MRGIQIFLNGDFMGSTTVSGLPALQNLCQALSLDQNWAEEEKAFYITATAPVTNPDYSTVAHLGVGEDGVRMVVYPDPTIALPPNPEPPVEAEFESNVGSEIETLIYSQVQSPIVHSASLDPTPPMTRVAGTRSASPDPRTPPGSGAVFVFRSSTLLPGETLNSADAPLMSDSFQPAFTSPAEPQSEPPTELRADLQEASPEEQPTPPEPSAPPVSLPINRPLNPARRKTPPRAHVPATRIIQSGATVIRI